jgi:hypothetical protein
MCDECNSKVAIWKYQGKILCDECWYKKSAMERIAILLERKQMSLI